MKMAALFAKAYRCIADTTYKHQFTKEEADETKAPHT